ncbi:5-methylcytosine-specific restriction endonuclease system specificity protein McrC [Sedimentibacter sp. zth1]|uniref:5-methylcytosine-specific restriction endonuclease system specificity protein McrC n=1 Tax=Sedimentibacter sp. zth1 TaxID=2816908 RepID=UPI001A91C65B|nr:5-methylcytosine-specific restriction endonuclease system specificity protein McrC [Sedimentibacter sp. zth1]QSX05599.1 5-methylcytosine-specific restriction endonuclease system specificity protein McrC [Sedimentibacter sp. zth1]
MIKVRNIYYMLSYAFRILSEEKYQDVETEEFEYAADLFASILGKGISNQIKRSLGKNYIEKTDNLSSPHGKLDISNSIKVRTMLTKKLSCVYDSYEENTYMNQVLKATSFLLIKAQDVKIDRKRALKKVMLYFENVDFIQPRSIVWSNIQYSRNNSTYKMLMNICYLVINGLLISEEEGSYRMFRYVDDRQMHNLYEKFILEYYKKHYPEFRVTAAQIDWNVDNGFIELLPAMKSDITLEYKGKTIIIDAKYYSRMLQYNQMFNSRTVHSNNMYQIFTYVKNKDTKANGLVSGILLYAKTDEEIAPDQEYLMSGNKISVKTLDLGAEFKEIAGQLNTIAEELKG